MRAGRRRWVIRQSSAHHTPQQSIYFVFGPTQSLGPRLFDGCATMVQTILSLANVLWLPRFCSECCCFPPTRDRWPRVKAHGCKQLRAAETTRFSPARSPILRPLAANVWQDAGKNNFIFISMLVGSGGPGAPAGPSGDRLSKSLAMAGPASQCRRTPAIRTGPKFKPKDFARDRMPRARNLGIYSRTRACRTPR